MKSLLNPTDPALSFVRECLRQPHDAGAALINARDAIAACRDYLTLFAPPSHEPFGPAALIQSYADALSDFAESVEVEPVGECLGDPTVIALCVRILARNARLFEDAGLIVEVFEEKEVARVRLSIDGPGQFPPRMFVGGTVAITRDELGACWTRATRGGRIDVTAQKLDLRLKGIRVVPPPIPEAAGVLTHLDDAARHINAAMATADCAPKDTQQAIKSIESALESLDGPGTLPKPTDVKALLTESKHLCSAELEESALTVEAWVEPSLPPLAVRRNRLAAFFESAFLLAAESLDHGGSVTILVDYDAQAHVAGIAIELTGAGNFSRAALRCAAMRRVIVEDHGGAFEAQPEEKGFEISATIPDTIGQALEAWIPGYEGFDDRSKQMLRLLKSGGPAPPEDFVLGGVLEAELERWLLPLYESAPIVNAAYNLKPVPPELPGASPERLEKALTQIRRGKPRKEIAGPAYAGEALWAFGKDPRPRKALSIESMKEETLRRLCIALLQGPPDCLAALRVLAKFVLG